MDKRVKYGIFGGLALVFFCIVLVFYLPDCFGGEKTKASKLENWSRSIKGQEDRIVTLPEKLFRRDGEMVKIHDEEVIVTISKGPEIKIPDLKKFDITKITEWAIKNKVKLTFTDQYDEAVKD